MERIASLSTGTKITLAAGILLFFDLFFTWQDLPQRFGGRFDVTESLDGWDRWGLLVGLLTLALVTLVIVREANAELSPDVPWNLITLALASLVLGLTLLKNITDAHSAWASYLGVVLAALLVVGTYLDRNRPLSERAPAEKWRVRARAPQPSTSSGTSPDGPASAEPEPHAADSSKRW